jgi:hypothetical protein
MQNLAQSNWPSARHFSEAIQCPAICFRAAYLRDTIPAVDRLGMPLVTSGQFAYVYKLRRATEAYAVRCFRGHLGDRENRYRAIDEHLRAHPTPALAGFAYEADGILVGGRKFPILTMEWIDGPTLDVYLDEVINRPDVLLHLADEWVRLMELLRAANVAHGDLQHGNIIVEHGHLRLVDFDGMFVPAMKNWTASELGHQHYQHPSRNEKLFDVNLDNFSALVVYLSLISLAELPDLWKEHHDENLIFTKADFLAPEASALFAKVKEIGAEHRRLAEILETAAKSDPSKVPSLLELVTAKSKLPAWMVAPIGADVIGKTREVQPVKNAATPATPAWTTWEQHRDRAMPQSPGSHTVQSVFSGTPPAQNSAIAVSPPTNPSQIGKNTLIYAREFSARKKLVWWYIGLYNVFNVVGEMGWNSIFIALLPLIFIALIYGFNRALKERDAFLRNASLTGSNALSPSSSPAKSLPGWMMKANAASAQNASQPMLVSVTADAIIANRALGIYHSPDCDWADTISPKNQVGFPTPQAAQTAGYHACKVCAP